MKKNQTTDSGQILDFEIRTAIGRLEEAIVKRREASGTAAGEAEKMICIETRSLFVAFKDYTLWCGPVDSVAEQVSEKLNDALGAVSLEPACVNSVKRRVEREFQEFLRIARSDRAAQPV